MPEFSPSTSAAIEATLGDPKEYQLGDHVEKVIDGQIKVFAGNSSYFQSCRILIDATIIEKDGQRAWKTRTEVL